MENDILLLNWKTIRAGLIPWSAEEFYQVLKEGHRLMETPHDDWDRTPRRVRFYDEETEEESEITFNVDRLHYQVDIYMHKRYAGEPATTTISHIWRFYQIQQFVRENFERLESEGLVISQEEENAIGIVPSLVEVLSTEPYEEKYIEEGEEFGKFDYQKVVAKAKRIEDEEDEE